MISITTRSFARGETIHLPGTRGGAWTVLSGSVRIDRQMADERMFVSLARRDDVIGAEALVGGVYEFLATALCVCHLVPWGAAGKGLPGRSGLALAAMAERRAAQTIALRWGNAVERVRRLILMLAEARAGAHCDAVAIPAAQDMADMTGLTKETVSRAMTHLRREGLLQKHGARFGLIFHLDLAAA